MTGSGDGRVALLMVLVLGASPASAAVAQFDINDAGTASPTLAGWTPVVAATNDAETLTGSDGTRTLTLTTTGDGQDRDRNAASFTVNAALWRDFWFVSDSGIGGATATATLGGLTANTFYSVEILAYDTNSTPTRAASWTDAVSGNSAVLSFNGATTPVPVSPGEGSITLQAKTNGAGVLTLTAAAAAGGSPNLPNVFVSGIRVTDGASRLPSIEAESGLLGAGFTVNTLQGATHITISSTSSSTSVPESGDRMASYSVPFPLGGVYQLYARVLVGPGGFNDDSFFHGNGFGAKSPANASDWVFVNGLAANLGFTVATDVVTVGGGTAGIQVWKWLKFPTLFNAAAGTTQTFQIGGREDGFAIDRFVFAPSDVVLTVAELESGMIAPPPELNPYDGPDGMAIHRFAPFVQGLTADGANPASGLVLIGGELQGNTLNGGSQGDGAAFRVSLDGMIFQTLASFAGGPGIGSPKGGLLESAGGYFGVSLAGGTFGAGTIFHRQPGGSVSILRSFAAVIQHNGSNAGGASPSGMLALDGTTLYGTAMAAGSGGNGTVFSISTSGTNFNVLRNFSTLDSSFGTNLDGARPRGGIVRSGGKLYGTTSAGGSGGTGLIFMMDPNGANYTVLHDFDPIDPETAANATGAMPFGGLVVSNGVIHGTTLGGGAAGKGTLFSIRTDGGGFTTLHQFSATDPATGSNPDGASPAAGLTLAGNVLYGTTSAGGGGGSGTVFALDPSVPDFRVFLHFQALAADGTNPYGAHPVAPLLRVGHALFGTAFAGGAGGTGTVFRIPIPLTADVEASGNVNGSVSAALLGRGAPGSNYSIWAADHLNSNWQNMGTQSADASGFIQYLENNPNSPRRFYRIIEAP